MIELLNIKNLQKSFDGIIPINDVSFALNKNNSVLISGENGTGKTTLFNLITGLEKPTKGSIVFNGEDITGKMPLEIARLGIIRLYQHPRLFKNLLVWENLVSAGHYCFGNSFINHILKFKSVKTENENIKQKAISLLAKFELQDLTYKKAGELSYGQKKLISFCMIAMNGTKLALLDEPFAGLNPQTIEQLSDIIVKMKTEGITFLIIEHNINKASVICDSHLEMKNGEIKQIDKIVTV